MGKFTTILFVAALGMVGYRAYHRTQLAQQQPMVEEPEEQETAVTDVETPSSPAVERDDKYQCDGRTRCGQFHSCDEATWFVEHCPGMKMDGDNDGVPCEDHLCPHS